MLFATILRTFKVLRNICNNFVPLIDLSRNLSWRTKNGKDI